MRLLAILLMVAAAFMGLASIVLLSSMPLVAVAVFVLAALILRLLSHRLEHEGREVPAAGPAQTAQAAQDENAAGQNLGRPEDLDYFFKNVDKM